MNKQEFLNELSQRLSGLPDKEIADVIQYYGEYFDEAGAENEEKTMNELGSAAEIAKKLLAQARASKATNVVQDSSGGWGDGTNGQKLSAFHKIDASTAAESISIKYGNVYAIEVEGDASVISHALDGDTLKVWRVKNFFGISFRTTRVIITIPARTRLEKCRGSSVSGSLHIAIDAKELEAKTTSGSIEINGSYDTTEVSSVSGSIKASGSAEDFGAKTTSGAISIEGKIGDIRASTVSGKIKMRLEACESDYTMNFSSVSGSITAGRNKFGRRAQFGSGNLRLDAKTTSGSISIGFTKGGDVQ